MRRLQGEDVARLTLIGLEIHLAADRRLAAVCPVAWREGVARAIVARDQPIAGAHVHAENLSSHLSFDLPRIVAFSPKGLADRKSQARASSIVVTAADRC